MKCPNCGNIMTKRPYGDDRYECSKCDKLIILKK